MDSPFANISHFGDFLSMNIPLLDSLNSDRFDKNVWILDNGATDYMCSHLSYMTRSTQVISYIPIFLPDGSINSVTHTSVIE